MKKNINVIDLDKTLIPYDSFRLLIKSELNKLDVYLFTLTLRRVFRLIGADKFKQRSINYLRTKYDEDFFKKFADKLIRDINPVVMDLIEKESSASTMNILLSASPNIFVQHFIQKLDWVGSGSYTDSRGNYVHLYGGEKVKWLLRTYKKEAYNYNFAISDSITDDQLLILFKRNIKWTLQ